jgi:hypothetical protein
MSKYIFYAKINKSFINPLKIELKQLGVETDSIINLNDQGLNFLRFQSDFQSLWKIMLYSRMIEGLKMQMAEKIIAM